MNSDNSSPCVLRPNPVKKWIRTHFLERTLKDVPRTDRVLDLCCGYGFYFSINPQAKGVDGDAKAVSYLRNKGFDVTQCNILGGLPYPREVFENVVAHDVLEHFEYDELVGIFAEVHRVLKTGGSFWVFVPNQRGYDAGLRPEVGHKLFVTKDEILRLSEKLFSLKQNFAEPLPRVLGKWFTHNKEVFELVKI